MSSQLRPGWAQRCKNFSRAVTMAGGQRRTVLTQSRSL